MQVVPIRMEKDLHLSIISVKLVLATGSSITAYLKLNMSFSGPRNWSFIAQYLVMSTHLIFPNLFPEEQFVWIHRNFHLVEVPRDPLIRTKTFLWDLLYF